MSTGYGKEIEDKLFEEIKEGATIRSACQSAGIGVSTFYDWMNENKTCYRSEVSERYKEARNYWKKQSAVRCINAMQKRAEGFAYEEETKRRNPKTGKMEVVETKTKYIHSDTAAIFLATNHDKDNYQQRNVIDNNIRGKLDVNQFDIKLTPEQQKEYDKRMKGFMGDGVELDDSEVIDND